jgi:hypothetical protein
MQHKRDVRAPTEPRQRSGQHTETQRRQQKRRTTKFLKNQFTFFSCLIEPQKESGQTIGSILTYPCHNPHNEIFLTYSFWWQRLTKLYWQFQSKYFSFLFVTYLKICLHHSSSSSSLLSHYRSLPEFHNFRKCLQPQGWFVISEPSTAVSSRE